MITSEENAFSIGQKIAQGEQFFLHVPKSKGKLNHNCFTIESKKQSEPHTDVKIVKSTEKILSYLTSSQDRIVAKASDLETEIGAALKGRAYLLEHTSKRFFGRKKEVKKTRELAEKLMGKSKIKVNLSSINKVERLEKDQRLIFDVGLKELSPSPGQDEDFQDAKDSESYLLKNPVDWVAYLLGNQQISAADRITIASLLASTVEPTKEEQVQICKAIQMLLEIPEEALNKKENTLNIENKIFSLKSYWEKNRKIRKQIVRIVMNLISISEDQTAIIDGILSVDHWPSSIRSDLVKSLQPLMNKGAVICYFSQISENLKNNNVDRVKRLVKDFEKCEKIKKLLKILDPSKLLLKKWKDIQKGIRDISHNKSKLEKACAQISKGLEVKHLNGDQVKKLKSNLSQGHLLALDRDNQLTTFDPKHKKESSWTTDPLIVSEHIQVAYDFKDKKDLFKEGVEACIRVLNAEAYLQKTSKYKKAISEYRVLSDKLGGFSAQKKASLEDNQEALKIIKKGDSLKDLIRDEIKSSDSRVIANFLVSQQYDKDVLFEFGTLLTKKIDASVTKNNEVYEWKQALEILLFNGGYQKIFDKFYKELKEINKSLKRGDLKFKKMFSTPMLVQLESYLKRKHPDYFKPFERVRKLKERWSKKGVATKKEIKSFDEDTLFLGTVAGWVPI